MLSLLDHSCPSVSKRPEGPAYLTTPIYEHTFQIGYLDRFPLGTPYPAQVERVKELVERLKGDRVRLNVDATGVGRPVVDLMRREGLEVKAVVITAGDTEAYADGFHRVPKRNLVSTGQVLLQSGRIKIHSSTVGTKSKTIPPLRKASEAQVCWRSCMQICLTGRNLMRLLNENSN